MNRLDDDEPLIPYKTWCKQQNAAVEATEQRNKADYDKEPAFDDNN